MLREELPEAEKLVTTPFVSILTALIPNFDIPYTFSRDTCYPFINYGPCQFFGFKKKKKVRSDFVETDLCFDRWHRTSASHPNEIQIRQYEKVPAGEEFSEALMLQ